MDQAIENAVRFISDMLKEEPAIDRLYLVEMAGHRFDLTPIQTEHLITKYVFEELQPR